MKPSFALNLSPDGIGLLHRTIRGWLVVGEVSLDDPDLANALAYLRSTALALEPRGLTAKLIVPNSQILYTRIAAPGPSDVERRAQIAAALEGTTPYAVDDLVFDWAGTGPEVQVAVVARETLDEAETFAAEHRFNPVAFVARPDEGGGEGDETPFDAEPFFGQTRAAAALLAPGAEVERDDEPVRIVGRAVLPRKQDENAAMAVAGAPSRPARSPAEAAEADVAASAETENADREAPISASRTAPEKAERRNAEAAKATPEKAETAKAAPKEVEPAKAEPKEPGPEKAEPREVEPAKVGTEKVEGKDAGAPEPGPAEPPASPPARAAQPAAPPPPASNAASARLHIAEVRASDAKAGKTAPATAASDSGAAEATGPEGDAAPALTFSSRRPAQPAPATAEASPVPQGDRSATHGAGADTAGKGNAKPRKAEPGPGPAGAALKADKQRGQSDTPPAPATAGKGAAAGLIAAPPAGDRAPPLAAPGASASLKGKKPPDAESRPQGARKDAPAAPQPVPTPMKPPQDEATAMTVFGARGTGPARGRGRHIGLAVVVLILVALIGLAALWSSLVLGRNETAPRPVQSASLAPAPARPSAVVSPAPLPSLQIPDVPEGQTPSASPAATARPAPQSVTSAPEKEAATPAAGETAPPPAAATAPQPTGSVTPSLPSDPATRLVPADIIVQKAPEPRPSPTIAARGEIYLAGIDPKLAQEKPGSLPMRSARETDIPLPAQINPPAYGTRFTLNAEGLVKATPDGAVTPQGVMVYAALPPAVPPRRPGAPAPAAPAPAAPALPAATPPGPEATQATPAPEGTQPTAEPAGEAAAPAANPELAGVHPRARPAGLYAQPEAATPDAAAAGEPEAADDGNISPLAVAGSPLPPERPTKVAASVAAALAAARAGNSSPQESQQAASAPRLPTNASVAKEATMRRAISLNRLSLIGVFGTESNRQAMLRASNGRIIKVSVGDRLDGGKVAAIGEHEMHYVKRGRNIVLSMPQ